MQDTVTLGPGFSIPVDYLAGRSIALLGKRGAGKTATCRVLVEELHAAHVQTVIVDPMGVFWGLRAAAGGKRGGLPIPVFGGGHADAPLEASAGALMADIAVQDGLSMILDLSGFTSRTQERGFARDFFDRLYRMNQHLLHLVVDEADLFGPQKPRREDAPLLVALENIVRRGRNKGIGITMASQRAAVLNKDLLSQVDVLGAMRVTGPQDRAAIQEWVRGQGDDQQWAQIAPSLPTLATGEAWWWAPERSLLARVQGRLAHTFDSSPTRDRGHTVREPRTFADVDLAAISDRIAATVERAQQTDPKELTRRIAELERELSALRARPTATETVEVSVEIPVEIAPAPVVEAVSDARALLAQAQERLEHAEAELSALAGPSAPAVQHKPPPPSLPKAPLDDSPKAPLTHSSATPVVGEELTPARSNLLSALSAMASIGLQSPSKTQLALWAQVSPRSSGYANNLGALRSRGLIDYPSPGHVAITPTGQELAQPVDLIPTDQALHDHVRSLLNPARWRILEQLIAAAPAPLTKHELATRAGASPTSSGYANNLGALRSMGLLDYPTPGHVASTDALFLRGL